MSYKEIKELVADESLRIELHDRIVQNIKKLLEAFESDQFSNEAKYSQEEFKRRIEKCEELTEELCAIQALIGYWGSEEQKKLFTFAIKNISTSLKNHRSGNNIWRAVKWHSSQLLFYHGGISAVATERYHKLHQLFDLMVPPPAHTQKMVTFSQALLFINGRIDNVYNVLIENESHKTPLSEYLYTKIESSFNDIMGIDLLFESSFDHFELMRALDYIDRKHDDIPDRVWGPIGKFRLKVYEDDPFHQIKEDAETQKENWQPLQAGFFRGSYERFQKICTSFQERLQRFRW